MAAEAEGPQIKHVEVYPNLKEIRLHLIKRDEKVEYGIKDRRKGETLCVGLEDEEFVIGVLRIVRYVERLPLIN